MLEKNPFMDDGGLVRTAPAKRIDFSFEGGEASHDAASRAFKLTVPWPVPGVLALGDHWIKTVPSRGWFSYYRGGRHGRGRITV